ncbi:hypothetical protein FRC00_009632, partial [Tulasnella sp. 408]
MATSPPDHLNLPPPAFPQGPPASPSPPAHSKLGTPRKSFGHRSFNRPGSARAKYMALDEEYGDEDYAYESKPPIPSALPKQDENPLPILPMLVLSIAMLGEFLSANVSTPFLLFMVEGFGIEKSQVGSYTGILVSMFFVTQFLTSILWATIADKHEGLIRLVEKDGQEILPTVAELHESPTQGTPAESRSLVDEARPETVVDKVAEQAKHVQKKISGYFARRVREAYSPSPRHTPLVSGTHALPIPGSGRMKPRTLSQVTGPGSAYGYTGVRSRLGSTVTGGAGRSPGAALRRRRLTGQSAYAGEEATGTEDLTFAQRLLLANEQNVTNMANLWVAAAINADNEDPFYEESEADMTPAGETPGMEEGVDQESVFLPEDEDSRPATPAVAPARLAQTRASSSRPSFSSSAAGGRFRPSFGFGPLTQLTAPSPRPSQREVPGTTPHQTPRFPPGTFGTPRIPYRRGSSTSNLGLPAIYNNTGLSSPPALAQDVISL